jgi:hypothetical protein
MRKVGAGSYIAGAKRSSIEWKLVVKCMGRMADMGLTLLLDGGPNARTPFWLSKASGGICLHLPRDP